MSSDDVDYIRYWLRGAEVSYGPYAAGPRVDTVRGYLPGLPPGVHEWRGLRVLTLGTGNFPGARWKYRKALLGTPRAAEAVATALHEPFVYADGQDTSLLDLRLRGRVVFVKWPAAELWTQMRQAWLGDVWNDTILVVDSGYPKSVEAVDGFRWQTVYSLGLDPLVLENLRHLGFVARKRGGNGMWFWRRWIFKGV